jgi:hypothetical protein
MVQGKPKSTLELLQGRVFSKMVEQSALEAVKQEFKVLTSRLMEGRPRVFVYADSNPGEGFEPVEAGLEEVYFYHIQS